MARRSAAALLASLFALACARSGEVIVVLDSTMRSKTVEVVAFRVDGIAAAARPRERPSAPLMNAEVARLRALEDSAGALAVRFRTIRDSLNTEVLALGRIDRRTRSYAVRYAEIRRRTLAAEQIRSRRDSTRAHASALRASAGIGTSRPIASTDDGAIVDRDAGGQRHPVRDSVVSLTLMPGRWVIGAAPRGSMPLSVDTVTVVRGTRITVRLGSRMPASSDTP